MENKPESAYTQEALCKLGGIVTKVAHAILIQCKRPKRINLIKSASTSEPVNLSFPNWLLI